MDMQDYLVALTVSLLTCEDSRLSSAESALDGGPLDYHSPAAIQRVSAGGRTADGKMTGLFAWVDALRGHGPLTVRVIDSRATGRPGNDAMPAAPAHIIASFAGAEVTVLRVDGGGKSAAYFLTTIFSTPVLMRAPDFVRWVDGQQEQEEIQDRLLRVINESNAMNERPEAYSAREFLLTEEGQAHFDFNHENLLLAVQEALHAAGKTPAMGQGDEKFFKAPEPTERLRLAANPDPFTLYLFEQVNGIDEPPPAREPVRSEYLAALKQCEAFARKVESPFFEAFKLATWILESDGNTEGVTAAAAGEGFSERAQSILKSEAGPLVGDFRLLGWPEQRLRALLSFSIADVFGGMGSWNDMVFDGEDQARYQEVTEKLYAVHRSFFVSDVLNQ